MYFSFFVPVEEVDDGFSRHMSEGHIVKDDPIVFCSDFSECVEMTDEEWIFELMESPLGFSCSGCSMNEQDLFKLFMEQPSRIGIRVFIRSRSFDIVSDEHEIRY